VAHGLLITEAELDRELGFRPRFNLEQTLGAVFAER
jgi:hypothetical protein